ncbi:MAG TPA: hypothetical protein EYG03_09460 [Planctomycetes bacterium]|nr:hypothetical protein [Fuerstiella sp.]HIK92191.1 hypothetical protein [Planctomycetota bacterium]
MAAMDFRGSVAQLEAEGHELETVLNADAFDSPAAADNRAGSSGDSVAVDAGRGSQVHVRPLPASADRIGRTSETSFGESDDLEAVQAIVDRPATALMTVGVLTAIGSLIGLFIWLDSSRVSDREMAWLVLPGVIVGTIVTFGA